MKEKKYDDKTALAKIKTLIGGFYEGIGRQDIEDTDEQRQDLIEKIDDILNNTNISTKHLILEKLKTDDEVDKTLLKEWK